MQHRLRNWEGIGSPHGHGHDRAYGYSQHMNMTRSCTMVVWTFEYEDAMHEYKGSIYGPWNPNDVSHIPVHNWPIQVIIGNENCVIFLYAYM